MCQQAVSFLFTFNIHAACAHQLTKHERQHGGIILKHHHHDHTPEKQIGLQEAGKALNTHLHQNMRAAQETAATPERGYL